MSAFPVPLGSLPQRQGLNLFPLFFFRPLSFFYSLFNTHWALLSISPHSSLIYCLFPLHGNQIRRNSYFPFAPVFFFFLMSNHSLLPLLFVDKILLSFFGDPPSIYFLLPLKLASFHFLVFIWFHGVYGILLCSLLFPFQSLSFPFPLLTSTSHQILPLYSFPAILILHSRMTSLLSPSHYFLCLLDLSFSTISP